MEEIKLGIMKAGSHQQDMSIVGSTTKNVFDMFVANTANLNSFITQQDLFEIVSANFDEFTKHIDDAIGQFVSDQQTYILNENFGYKRYISQNSNRIFLNLLSSIRTYVDHTETYLKRKYPNDSNKFTKFKSKASELYDNNFEYRFMYKIRNYAQHCGLPLNGISVSMHTDENNEMKFLFNLSFNKNELLEKFKDWGAVVNKDLLHMPDEMNALSIVEKYYELISELNKCLVDIETESLKNSVQLLESFKNQSYDKVDIDSVYQYCILYNYKCEYPDPNIPRRKITFTAKIYPTELIENINTYI